ncbi:MAG: GDSL-type esterase/lipase family protein [Desulfovibrio sp.]|nr:GDSL-type esterase/lipase family protein [Desulfovibrio sp.]
MARARTDAWLFFGDSVTLGVNDHAVLGGWTSRLVLGARDMGLCRIPPDTLYNLAARRQTAGAVAHRWRGEMASREMPGFAPRLAFCLGVVDVVAPGGGEPVPLETTMGDVAAILEEAVSLAPTLLVAPPPVARAATLAGLRTLRDAQAEVCTRLGVPFADVQDALAASPEYMDDLSDGLHPGPAGCALMARLLLEIPCVREFLRTVPRET